MNQALYQSFQSAYSSKRQDDDSTENYFDDARQGLLKDLVDFQNRDDFDSYMRSIEKNYYHKVNVPQPPYETLPDYPPKPFQQKKSKKSQYEDQRKDFIDKVNEVNQRRQQAYSEQHLQYLRQMEQQQYYHQLQNGTINPYQNPYFDQIINKENSGRVTPLSGVYTPQYQMHTPSISGAHISNHGGYPMQQPVPGHYGQVMEPHVMQQMPPYLSKFVAGPTRLEANPLSEPNRNFKSLSPSKQQQPPPQLSDYDLKNPDVQFERYKNLMSNQYYNYHANSANQGGFSMTSAHTVYNPPPPFNYVQNAPQFAGTPGHQNDMFNVSFNPTMGRPQTVPQQIGPQGALYPQSQQIYPQLGSVSLYQPPPPMPNAHMPGGALPPQYVHPSVYRSIKQNNIVDKSIIDSIGGIEDTLKPLEDTLKQHELRPFQVQRDYRKEYYYSQKGKELKRSASECKPEHLKLVSVSPFRAVVKVDKHAQSQYINDNEQQQNDSLTDDTEEEEELQRNAQDVTQYRAPDYRSQGDRNSPIRNDSQSLRGPREQFLNVFNEKRSINSSLNDSYDKKQGMKEHQKIRMESEYLRTQREQFLNSFSQAPPQKPPQAHFAQR